MLNLCYVYYFSKLTEFADTIFFVLRKKKSQMTWLHLYHHSLTPLEAWILVKFLAGKISPTKIIIIQTTHLPNNQSIIINLSTFILRWKCDVPEYYQQFRAHLHVLLLHDVSNGSTIPEILVVEKIHDRIANCKYFHNILVQNG